MNARIVVLAGVVVAVLSCSDGDDGDGTCSQPDQDGVVGGAYSFVVEVSDQGFSPLILKAQNSGDLTITLKNVGTRPHGFTVGCLVVSGCQACFPPAATIAPLAPGESKTATFTAPEQEGIYTTSSNAPDDTFTGQLILQ